MEAPSFLRLPPDTLQRVFEFALGGHVLHAAQLEGAGKVDDVNDTENADDDEEYRMQTTICSAVPNELRLLPSNMTPTEDEFVDNFCGRTVKLLVVTSEGSKLRTLYAEATKALLTFSTFAFASPIELEQLARRIGHGWLKYLRHILLYSTNHRWPWKTSTAAWTISDLPLGHSHSLDVFLEICPADFMPESGTRPDTIQAQDRAVGMLEDFKRLRPRRVRVRVTDYEFDDHRHGQQVEAAKVAFAAWVERIKHIIAPPKDVSDEDEAAAADGR